MNKSDLTKQFHLAGVVPVAGQPLDFNFPWHDCCMPIAQNYLAIERAIVECAYAGCETIWIVCNDDMQPLIRHRLGEYVNDPVWAVRLQDPKQSQRRKQIPIFYVPIHPNDRDKRDCLAWSVLHGAMSAYSVSKRISKWVTPDRFYTAFPYGIYPTDSLRERRKNISSRSGFAFSHKGKTIKDGEYLGFTFSSEQFIEIRRSFRKKGTGMFKNTDHGIPQDKLPLEERYSARLFSLKDVFEDIEFDKEEIVELPWYHSVDNWEDYCNFINSENRKEIRRPPKYILDYHEWNLIGEDNYDKESENT